MDWTFATIATLYDTGEVDDSFYTYQPMDFQVGFGFPEQAKIAMAVVVLVWFIVRWARRRRARQASS